MALTVTLSHGSSSGGGNGVRSLCNKPSKHFYPRFPPCHHVLFTVSPRTLHLTSAAKKFSSRTGRFGNKNRRGNNVGVSSSKVSANGKPYPELPGLQLDLYEGTQWDVLGFPIQYLWAFGIVFALIACGISVATYNEEATDFKETPAYKESIQSRELLEEPDVSNSDVFESNPTDVAPSFAVILT
ncbi:hypothetical protein CXB51_019247 [Gossypium anomalum]|uniref:Uncharacterized protein n=1 Tax=Gossypium anomalum TaxID=47600 RepID=A0A8J5YKM0_9ROSI|nr:hypothetical protein CXB51_019247 [Gossypium anomalum]